MASQPLDTIPEEPTTAPTPPNSPAPARVTADPPQTKPAKNPGRVASGKRLAERNRLAREAKKQQAQAEAASGVSNTSTASAQPTATAATANDSSSSSSSLSLVTVLGVGGLIVFILGVYYQREAIRARFNPAPPAQPALAPTPAPSRIPVKRDIKEME